MWDSNHSLIRFAEFLSKTICFYGSPKRSERSVEGNCSKELLGHRFDHTFAGICGIYGISGTHLFYIINIFPKISSFFNTCFMGSSAKGRAFESRRGRQKGPKTLRFRTLFAFHISYCTFTVQKEYYSCISALY